MGSIKDIPREKIPWYPTVREEKCTGCGACVEFCPNDVYELTDKAVVKNPYSCVVGCSGCVQKCPAGAISFPTLMDLREKFKELSPLRGGGAWSNGRGPHM